MISKVQKPKTKQDLVKAINQANLASFSLYEGNDISKVPTKYDLTRTNAVVLVLHIK
jgi:hypothetical protein